MFCVSCDAGTRKVVDSSTGSVRCTPCPVGSIARAGSINCTVCTNGKFADDNGAACSRCAANMYHAYAEDTECTPCPTVGVKCENSQITIEPSFWFKPKNATKIRINERTKFYPCLNADACMTPQPGDITVTCDQSKGYQGVLCGDCSMKRGFVRTGSICSKCPHIALTIFLVCALFVFFTLTMVYYVGCMSFDGGDALCKTW